MNIQLKTVEPTCGPCTLCCKVMGIKEEGFVKPKDTWCPHAKKKEGCGIYHHRPTCCQRFLCLWVTGNFGGVENRPDRTHGVPTLATDNVNLVIHEDPGYPGHARIAYKAIIDSWLARSLDHYVIIVSGRNRSFLGQRAKYDALKAAGISEVADP